MFLKEILTHRISKIGLNAYSCLFSMPIFAYSSVSSNNQHFFHIRKTLELAGLKGSYLGFKLFSDKASQNIKHLRKMLF